MKVLVVDDIETIRMFYKKVLEKEDDIEVCATAQNGYEAVMQTAIHRPDIILMDIEMESKTAGIEAIKQILSQFPNIKIIVMTIHDEDSLIFESFKLGAVDYMIKSTSEKEIVKEVRDVYRNQCSIKPEIASKLKTEFRRLKEEEESFLYYIYLLKQLTQTELEILSMFLHGKTREEICEEKYIESSTLNTHIRRILKKFYAKSIKEVIQILEKSGVKKFLNTAAENC